ncbi:MAG TPA: efflux RND transporter periplasmic adaptor subunit [Gemmataceae bacterium]|jgi:multidrug efflux pump subunit AcrA (membrane-fusion protein)
MKQLLSRGGWVRVSVLLALISGVIGGAAYFWGGRKAKAGSEEQEGNAAAVEIAVKVVRPRFDKQFTMTERRPADILPYFEADLETRVPGLVTMLRTDVGDIVKKGDLLVEVDVPDLKARAEQQEAAWKLAKAQRDQKVAAIESAEAHVEAVAAKLEARRAKVKQDEAYLKFRTKQLKRFQDLLASGSIEARLVDEQEDRYEAALDARDASQEAVKAAIAEQKDALAKVVQAKADLKEAERKIDVAKAEWDYAKSMLSYSTVRAPFDGVIVRRNVDPGFFVQNAGNGHATPLLRIERNDIVTVVMRLPDNYAPFITPETEAIFETPLLPGLMIHGKVTRFPPSLINPEHDRTMLVEVDLWNRSADEYKAKMADTKFTSSLKKGMPGDPNEGKPILPEIKGQLTGGRQQRLLPGTFGYMTLVLKNFTNTYMLPSSAIVNSGGNTSIYMVQDGKAHMQRVKVQIDDGKLVKIELLGTNGKVLGDLTGNEVVIVSNQDELSEGQPVKPTLVEDWNGGITDKTNER